MPHRSLKLHEKQSKVREGDYKRKREMGKRGKSTVFEHQSTQEIPPWATVEDSYWGNRLLPAGLWMASPRGLSQLIISKLLLSSPWAEALPSTHADIQSLVFSPEETKGCCKDSTAPTWTTHPQGAKLSSKLSIPRGLGTSAPGPKTHSSLATVTDLEFSKQGLY